MKKLLLFISLVALSASNQLFANYLTAGDLTYKSLGGTQFQLQLTVYTECGGDIQLDTYNSMTVFVKSKTLGITGSENKINLFRQGTYGEEIKLLCSSFITNCNGGKERGIRKYTFVGTFDLKNIKGYKPANDIVFFWQYDFRTDRLTSHSGSASDAYYVEAMINTVDAPTNSSPSFGSAAVFTACTTEPQKYSVNAVDSDKDKLSYSLINPKKAETTDLAYASGFSKTSPVSTSSAFVFDTSGTISFVATTPKQSGLTDIKIEEWRNGKLIGYLTRGIQMNTFDCSNAKPSITGFLGTSKTALTFCEGETLNQANSWFKVTDADSNTQQAQVYVELGDAGFLVPQYGKNPKGYFSRTLLKSDVGTHIFVVTAEDNGCPTPQKNQQTFTITVLPKPVVSLGVDKKIPCDAPTLLKPTITVSTASPFSYSWTFDGKPANGTDSIFSTKALGNYQVTVKDTLGCSGTASINLQNSLSIGLLFQNRCLGTQTDFSDKSTSFIGTIATSTWELTGNGITENLTGLDVNYTFPKEGTYKVKHIVANSVGCSLEQENTVEICTKPVADFDTDLPCQRIGVFSDKTIYPGLSCSFQSFDWKVDGVSNGGGPIFTHQFATSGQHTIEMNVITMAKCTLNITKNVEIFGEPTLGLKDKDGNIVQAPFQLNCNNPIKTLQSYFVTNPNGGTKFAWYKDGKIVSTSATYDLDGTGFYRNIITDSKGCDDTTDFSIIFPLNASFSYVPACQNNDKVGFTDLSTSIGSNIVAWNWNFGDTTSSNIQNPEHLYNVQQDYPATLVITDNNGCKDTTSQNIVNTSFIDVFSTNPNVATQTICSKDVIEARSVIASKYGHHIDLITWDFGDGTSTSGSLSNMDTVKFSYNTYNDQVKNLNFTVKYNTVNGKACTYTNSKSIPFQIKPAFFGEIIPFRSCTKDTAVFKFERTSGADSVGIKNYTWILAPQNSINVLYDIKNPILSKTPFLNSNESQGRTVFKDPSSIDVYVLVKDNNGCEYAKLIPAAIEETAVPFVKLDTVCLGDTSKVLVGTTNRTPSGKIAIANIYGADYGQTNIAEGNAIRKPDNTIGTIAYKFSTPGVVPIKVYMKKNTTIFPLGINGPSYIKECRAVVDTSIWVRPLPEPNFDYNKICAGKDTVRFNNLSTIKLKDSIYSYAWNIKYPKKDSANKFLEYKTTQKNPSKYFDYGLNNGTVSLTAYSKHCSNTISNSFVVYDQPKANFYFDSSGVSIDKENEFIDISTVNDMNPITKYIWSWGDNTVDTLETANAKHTFPDLKRYFIKYTIINDAGCRSSIEKPADTECYLDLPTAFSPNDDKTNDEIGLVHKLITELIEFKIYNRWGQVVFTTNDLNKKWDGKLDEKTQEMGVYVAHVVARGAYGREFNFKRNITLLK